MLSWTRAGSEDALLDMGCQEEICALDGLGARLRTLLIG